MQRLKRLGREITFYSLLSGKEQSPEADLLLSESAIGPTVTAEISLRKGDGAAKFAIDSERVREGLKDVLLGPGQLYEALRDRAGGTGEVVGK